MKFSRPSPGKLLACLSLLGAACLCYLLGAAVMHFQLATSGALRKAFIGAQAWNERGRSDDPTQVLLENPAHSLINLDKPDKTDDGFTLYATTSGCWAALIDMKGNIVHHWQMPFRKAWPQPTHAHAATEQHWFGCHLFPSGDLLAVYHGKFDTPYGYGLVKLDKDSNLLWAYAGNVHHELDVAEDGTIYALTQKLASKAPDGMGYVMTPYIDDALVILSPEGKELKTIPMLEAFQNSKYASTFELLTTNLIVRTRFDPKNPNVPLPPDLTSKGDFTHPNGIKVLRPTLAPKFPQFKAGQVLLSLRNMDALAVLDVDKRAIVWFTQGCWLTQHSPDFLENGHLLLFDNTGAKVQSRVLELDPASLAIPWWFASADKPYLASVGGKCQRLPSGNTLIVHPDLCRIFEVTPGKEEVWESFCVGPAGQNREQILAAKMTTMWRYRADELTFLKGVARVRP